MQDDRDVTDDEPVVPEIEDVDPPPEPPKPHWLQLAEQEAVIE